ERLSLRYKNLFYLSEDTRKLKMLFYKIEQIMKEQKPYLDGDFCVEDLARMVCSSKSYVSKAINMIGRSNFRPYINSYRVKYAADLIRRDPRMKMSEVASMSGFNSLPTFNSSFKSQMSMRPKDYLLCIHSESVHKLFFSKAKE
ncbi:MAG: helix-turn-helix domain-containing protein, partial [Candidatus Cryptobacteroides sp.]